MIASQLLRILQTIPSDVKQEESCVYGPAEQDTRMKESQSAMVYNHENLWRDENREGTFPPFLDLNGGDSSWNPFLTDFSSIDNENGSINSSGAESPNGFSHELVPDKDKEKHIVQNCPGFEDPNSDSDKKVVECESRDSLVHMKAMNDQVLKDICVVDDEGYLKDKVFIQGNENQSIVPDQVVGLLSFEDNVYVDGKLRDQGSSKSDLGSYLSLENRPESHGAADSMQKDELFREKDQFVDRMLPIQEYGTRSFLRSLVSSLESEETKVPEHPSQPSSRISGDDMGNCNAESGNGESAIHGTLHDTANNEKNSDADESTVVNQDKNDVGESSFSRASLITYSGPVTHAGNLSIRSDGSATSGRSFAFPVLQSEWNSSPVRMAKADGRHFRKHRGWRSGVFCCRF